MNKPETILTDAEMHALISGNPFTLGLSIARLKDFMRQVEKAVVAKQKAKETLDMMSYEVRELARNQPCGCIVCYCENQVQCLGCGARNCGTHDVGEIPNPVYVDHIADASKMVDADHIPDIGQMITPLAQRKIQSLLDKGEYRVIENATVLVNENGHAAIVNKGGAFYWVDNEALAREFDGVGVGVDSHHIADMRKKVPEGWQLVPVEPTDEMVQAADKSDEEYSKRSFNADVRLCQGGYDHYLVMLAAAPKYTGDSNE